MLIDNVERDTLLMTKPSKAWEIVSKARRSDRPSALMLIESVFENFYELHGDRMYGDDRALVGGLAFFEGLPITVIAQERGRSPSEHVLRNYAMMHPEGYRKAMRLALQAERFARPIIFIVDTPGAYPGIEAEERGQAEAIAQCLLLFSKIKTPIISIIMGQGGSGGALAFCVADKIMMFENATFSVISPEGFAIIYWKDAARSREAAEVLRMTAHDLMAFGILDEIIPESANGIYNDPQYSFNIVKNHIRTMLTELNSRLVEQVLLERQKKLRYII